MTPRRMKMSKLLAALIFAVAFGAFGVATTAPALADGWHGHGRVEHRDWRAHDWREHHDWRYYHPYRYYGYGYAYPGYYAPPPVYAPSPSLTVVVPFR